MVRFQVFALLSSGMYAVGAWAYNSAALLSTLDLILAQRGSSQNISFEVYGLQANG